MIMRKIRRCLCKFFREVTVMKILAVGDVVGKTGCEFLRKKLPAIKRHYGIDIAVVNGENSAEGNGTTPFSADHIFASGADVITGGNHTFRRREIYDYLASSPFCIRPANFPEGAPGSGMCIVDKGSYKAAVISIMGQVYMSPTLESPFDTADRMIKLADEQDCKIKIVDFHAEATGEKLSLAHYLDGRVTAFFGTHTHVPTADIKVTEKGTAYISDIGMTGPENSVLGVRADLTVAMMKDKLPARFLTADGDCFLCGAVFDVDKASGKAEKAEQIIIR